MSSVSKLISRRSVVAGLGAMTVLPHTAFAQGVWPDRAVRYYLGFAAGGATDALSRLFCQKMSDMLGQQFIVENRTGAGGVIGADAVAKSAKDGYGLGMTSIATNAIAAGTHAKLPFDPTTDFTFLSGLWKLPNVLVVPKESKVSTVKELLEQAKANPGKMTYATPGIGTTLHLSGEMMKSAGGVDIRQITYRGGAPAMVDLLAGRVDMLFDNLPGSLQQIRDGAVKALAVTTKERSPAIPDVPAMSEVLPGYDLTSWTALAGPAGLPKAVAERINEFSIKALSDPEVIRKFNELGAVPFPSSMAEIAAYQKSELERLQPIIKAAGIVPA